MADIDELVERVRALPGMVKAAAPDVARAMVAVAAEQIAAGTDPDGKPWPLTRDGRKPLADIAKYLTPVTVGTTAMVRLTEWGARHHFGGVRGGLARRVLPIGGEIPERYAQAVRTQLEKAFARATGGDR